MDENILTGIFKIKKILFYDKDSDYGIITAEPIDVKSGELHYNSNFELIFKGTIPEPKEQLEYEISGKETEDNRYGLQYKIQYMYLHLDSSNNEDMNRIFLMSIFTPSQVNEMYQVLDNPFQTLKDGDAAKLVQVKGVGYKTAQSHIDKFKRESAFYKLYTELKEYQFTKSKLTLLMRKYHNPDIIIQKVRENPYVLCYIKGFGWKTVDAIAMKGGLDPFSTSRIGTFILYYLKEQADNGYSYIPPDELMDAIIEQMGEDVPPMNVSDAIHELKDSLWWNDEKTKIGLKDIYDLEYNIATELIRLRDAESHFNIEGWQECISEVEEEQGWQYSDEQIEGIKTLLHNNVVVINGSAGTGKSSLVKGILRVLKHYTSVQTALAGRAASHLTEITQAGDGMTIHRLLGYGMKEEKEKTDDDEEQDDSVIEGAFMFNNNNKLTQDIIIVDEISMIGGYLFYYLLRAIKDGAKVLLLGDSGQLESIGCCNVASDIILSNEIPTVTLTQIFRQAQASAIITESIKIRNGIQIIEKDWVGVETRGELQDLTIDCYSEKDNTYYKIMKYVSEYIEEGGDINEMQVIVPQKEAGSACTWVLNNAIQKICNPDEKPNILVRYPGGKVGYLKVGDKVINMKNNYKTTIYRTYEEDEISEEDCRAYVNKDEDEDEDYCTYAESREPSYDYSPIYNGNIGTILEIHEGYMIIDFNDMGKIIVPQKHFNKIELGYAITVHKMQGSQYKCIIAGIDFSSFIMLSRQLLYTAITRATKKCILVAQNKALHYAIGHDKVSTKTTHLLRLLDEIAHPPLKF